MTAVAPTLAQPSDPCAPLRALPANPTPSAVETALREVVSHLKGADPLRLAAMRAEMVAILTARDASSPTQFVDAAIKTVEKPDDRGGAGSPVTFPTIEPWPQPVDGASLLTELTAAVRRYVVLPEHADVAVALWIIHAHAEQAAYISPVLGIRSPEKRCGKTTLLTLLSALVPKPLFASNVSTAGVYRTVEKHCPTFLLDEADTFLATSDELRGVLNSGHSRASAHVIRLVGEDFEPRDFSTWCPKAIALIGDLPETLTDRAIVVSMRRRMPGERVEPLRGDRLQIFHPLAQRVARWVHDHLGALRVADPSVPVELDDRAADNWRPLLTIADRAGGAWPECVRQAAIALSDGRGESLRTLLLSDVRDAFMQGGTHGALAHALETRALLAALCGRPDRPWATFHKGGPMTAAQLAARLKPFGIRPDKYREGQDTPRGYVADAALRDAFARYLPPLSFPPESSSLVVPGVPPHFNVVLSSN